MGNICCPKDRLDKKKKAKLSQYTSMVEQSFKQNGLNESMLQNDMLVQYSIIDTSQWFNDIEPNLNLLNSSQFMKLYQNYSQLQGYYEIIWEDIDMDTQVADLKKQRNPRQALLFNWKFLIRRGVPLAKIRKLLLKMFMMNWEDEIQDYYEKKKFFFLGKTDSEMRVVPSFSDADKQDQILKIDCLNENGINALHRVLWVLKESNPLLEYNPMIVQILHFLMIFLTEAESYKVVQHLIEQSQNLLDEKRQYKNEFIRSIRWHFTLTQIEFYKQVKLFVNLSRERSKQFGKIIDHFEKIGFRFSTLFRNWCANIFLNQLKFSTVIRIILPFLNEGIRTLYKIAYALCLIKSAEILQCQNSQQIEKLFESANFDNNIQEVDKLFQIAYTLRIKKSSKSLKQYELSRSIENQSMKIIYRPRVQQMSTIINYRQFEYLWDCLPRINKLSNPILIFSTENDGYSLNSLYSKTKFLEKNKPFLIIVQTQSSKFAAFSPQMIDLNQKEYYSSEDCFISMLDPFEANYPAINLKENQNYLMTNIDHIIMGSDEPAFQINIDLKGHTYQSQTFCNPPLNNKQNDSSFACLKLEFYILDF